MSEAVAEMNVIDDGGRVWSLDEILVELEESRSIIAASDIPPDLYKRAERARYLAYALLQAQQAKLATQ